MAAAMIRWIVLVAAVAGAAWVVARRGQQKREPDRYWTTSSRLLIEDGTLR